jgi:hypothetical protein
MSGIFIFGYGSLISEDSRKRTGNTSDASPATVEGLSRGWFIQNNDFFYASVAVIEKEDAVCNGVLFEVTEEMLALFDKREYGYQRIAIDSARVESEKPLLSAGAFVYTYVVHQVATPDFAHPIPLSYVDVIIQGCLEISEEFTSDFISNTDAWNGVWLNDIQNPIYVRPLSGTVDREKLGSLYLHYLDKEKEISRIDYLQARIEESGGV